MGHKRMTLYLLFWLLHKHFFRSSMTEVHHRVQTATDGTFTACWSQFVLSCEHSMYWQSKIKRNTVLCSSIINGCTGGGVRIWHVTLKATWQFQKTLDRLMRYLAFTVSVLLLCMKSTASKVYWGENKRLFLLWLLLFCTTAQRTKPRHFLKRDVCFLILVAKSAHPMEEKAQSLVKMVYSS